jgi:hypothetical protein
MKLSEIYKVKALHTADITFKDEVYQVRLLMQDEADSMGGKDLHEQLAFLIIEDGKSLEELGCVDSLRANMPLPHVKDLISEALKANAIDMTFAEKKSD